jgi:hypothetical protein
MLDHLPETKQQQVPMRSRVQTAVDAALTANSVDHPGEIAGPQSGRIEATGGYQRFGGGTARPQRFA